MTRLGTGHVCISLEQPVRPIGGKLPVPGASVNNRLTAKRIVQVHNRDRVVRNIADITYWSERTLSSVKPRPQSVTARVCIKCTLPITRDHLSCNKLMVSTRSPLCKHTSAKLYPESDDDFYYPSLPFIISLLPNYICELRLLRILL